jgi:cysteine synthase
LTSAQEKPEVLATMLAVEARLLVLSLTLYSVGAGGPKKEGVCDWTKGKCDSEFSLFNPRLGLAAEVLDQGNLDEAIKQFKERKIILPTFAQLSNPHTIPKEIQKALEKVGPDDKDPLNLFRIHWYNGNDRKTLLDVPNYLVLPKELTGVDATILIATGANFPMINAHKVLAAYGCLAPRLATGQFNPKKHRAIWPSTGNYCRGGVAISRIMGCRSSAVLPEGMSRERFEWLEKWVSDPKDIVRTLGTESNVKEIYDACNKLEKDKENFLFNQFADYGNHATHYNVTGPALHHVFKDYVKKQAKKGGKAPILRAFTSATGSAGTIAAGDYLKDHAGSKTVAIEALECPTMLYNGFGEHNVQGIGDKHVPLIHNVANTDAVVGVHSGTTDKMSLLIDSEEGRAYLRDRRGISAELVDQLWMLGYSAFANVIGAIKAAKYYGYGENDVIVTVATDSAKLYESEFEHMKQKYFGGHFDDVSAAETYGEAIIGASTADILELNEVERRRVFNLGYYTWVEQQNITVEEFRVRYHQEFWQETRGMMKKWDELITDFNARTGVSYK